MKVIAHSPAFWFLLAKDNDLFIDINCEHGPVSYDVLIMLNDEERAQYSAHGQNYLNTLAEAVNYSAPGARESDSAYKDRNISRERGPAVAMAIEVWKSQGSGC